MLEEHLGYVSDARRTAFFRQALARAVRPGDTVIDLGCGCGILGVLALEAGAGHVVAIDSGPILDVARQTFERLGAGGRVTVLSGHSHRLDLPARADVIVCDHIGYFGVDYGIMSLLRDARRRFLKPGGRIVPGLLVLKMAPVESSTAWAKVSGWQGDGVPAALHWVHALSSNTKHGAELDAAALISPPAAVHELNPADDTSGLIRLHHAFTAGRDAMLHGIAGFFAARLFDDVWMTNAPGQAEAINRPQAFLPLPAPVAVSAGEAIDVTVLLRPDDHVISWDIRLPQRGLRFRHSTLKSEAMDARTLRLADPGHRPRPGGLARARQTVLSYCDGTRTVAEIGDCVLRDHPGLMPSEDETRRFVRTVLQADAE